MVEHPRGASQEAPPAPLLVTTFAERLKEAEISPVGIYWGESKSQGTQRIKLAVVIREEEPGDSFKERTVENIILCLRRAEEASGQRADIAPLIENFYLPGDLEKILTGPDHCLQKLPEKP